MSLSFSISASNQASSGSSSKPTSREGAFSTGVVNRRPTRSRIGNGGSVGGFSFSATNGSPYRSPTEILYPAEKPILSPYTSLDPSPVRRVRGLATVNLRQAKYNKTE